MLQIHVGQYRFPLPLVQTRQLADVFRFAYTVLFCHRIDQRAIIANDSGDGQRGVQVCDLVHVAEKMHIADLADHAGQVAPVRLEQCGRLADLVGDDEVRHKINHLLHPLLFLVNLRL
ncbi:hypothetical protein D3C85_1468990 [compost metagenome]